LRLAKTAIQDAPATTLPANAVGASRANAETVLNLTDGGLTDAQAANYQAFAQGDPIANPQLPTQLQ
jgi:hypothetical protein